VYDLGGGTFDVSVLQIGKDVFEVLATAGDTYLGGDDFDDRIMTWLADDFLARHDIDLRQSRYCLQMLKEHAEAAKIAVGRDGVAEVRIPGICRSPEGELLAVEQTLAADAFNRMVMDLIQRTFKVCDEALQSARITAADVDAVILVGGPTRLPIVRNGVRHYFGREPLSGVDPDEVVALGASIQAAALLDTRAPELGQASYLLDVTPLTLRVGTVGGYTERIIDKNTPIPIEKSKTFTTSRDGQDRVRIRVYQGESSRADECELLGEFEFSGFRIGRRGDVQIEVTFEIDPNGIVNVSAGERETGQRASTTISLSSGLSEGDLRAATDRTAATELARA
jgi:molecular chaperone DnaK